MKPLEKTRSRSKREQKHFPKYLWLIRSCPCVICGAQAEAAHVRMSSAKYSKANGRDDKWCVPLCPGHHRLNPDAQHNSGEAEWWDRQGIDPLAIAKRLWESQDLQEMRAICLGVA
jgi:hypothetical protein